MHLDLKIINKNNNDKINKKNYEFTKYNYDKDKEIKEIKSEMEIKEKKIDKDTIYKDESYEKKDSDFKIVKSTGGINLKKLLSNKNFLYIQINEIKNKNNNIRNNKNVNNFLKKVEIM